MKNLEDEDKLVICFQQKGVYNWRNPDGEEHVYLNIPVYTVFSSEMEYISFCHQILRIKDSRTKARESATRRNL